MQFQSERLKVMANDYVSTISGQQVPEYKVAGDVYDMLGKAHGMGKVAAYQNTGIIGSTMSSMSYFMFQLTCDAKMNNRRLMGLEERVAEELRVFVDEMDKMLKCSNTTSNIDVFAGQNELLQQIRNEAVRELMEGSYLSCDNDDEFQLLDDAKVQVFTDCLLCFLDDIDIMASTVVKEFYKGIVEMAVNNLAEQEEEEKGKSEGEVN